MKGFWGNLGNFNFKINVVRAVAELHGFFSEAATKGVLENFAKIHRKRLLQESLFSKVAGLSLLSGTGVFLQILEKF